MNGIGLGVDLNSSLLDSQDTSKKLLLQKIYELFKCNKSLK